MPDPSAPLCQHSEHDGSVPECDGSGLLYKVLTPRLDHRDPAFAYEEWDCPGCPNCEDPMTRDEAETEIERLRAALTDIARAGREVIASPATKWPLAFVTYAVDSAEGALDAA